MRGLTLLLGMSGAVLLAACGPTYRDTDNVPTAARMVPEDLQVDDDLNVKRGDKLDWKSVTPMATGKATVIVRVGDPFQGKHALRGRVVVYDVDANEQARHEIEQNVIRYDLTWSCVAEKTYLVKMEGDAGKSPYTVEFSVEPSDPCALVECGPDETCEGGVCIRTVAAGVCNPPCKNGEECEDGKCVGSGCPGGCPKGSWCNKRAGTCVKDPCFGKKCEADETCKDGVCKKVRAGCDPPCGIGQVCDGGKCVEESEGETGPISATVVQAIPQGDKTVIILNRGSNHHVKVGHPGKIGGVPFKIIQVFAFRSKAVVDKPAEAFSTKARATIERN